MLMICSGNKLNKHVLSWQFSLIGLCVHFYFISTLLPRKNGQRAAMAPWLRYALVSHPGKLKCMKAHVGKLYSLDGRMVL